MPKSTPKAESYIATTDISTPDHEIAEGDTVSPDDVPSKALGWLVECGHLVDAAELARLQAEAEAYANAEAETPEAPVEPVEPVEPVDVEVIPAEPTPEENP